MTIKQCGIVIHEESCLCDVKPLNNVMIWHDGVTDMWLGKRIAEILGYPHPENDWTRESVIHWLETLVYVHDLFVESNNGHYNKSFEEIEPIVYNKGWSNLQKWKLVRDTVMSVANQYPNVHVIDILNKLQITLRDFIVAVTVNKSGHYMNETEFRSFNDDMVNTVKPNYALIGRVHKTGRGTKGYWKRLFQPYRDSKDIKGKL